jgi:hypothetical protein
MARETLTRLQKPVTTFALHAAGGFSMAAKKKAGTSRSGGALRNVVSSAAATETLLDLVDRLGLVDLLVGRAKSRLEEADLDELFEDIKAYLKENPEVLVVTLGAATVATGLLVWLNARREWDGSERRRVANESSTSSTGRVRKAS